MQILFSADNLYCAACELPERAVFSFSHACASNNAAGDFLPELQLRHIDRLGAFLALNDIKLDFLAFLKSLEAFAVDSCIMNENIVSL